MNPLKLMLAALVALLPLPALADVTAHYQMGGKTELTVEVASGGNARLEVVGKFALIRRDAVDYLVVHDQAETKVFELSEMIDFAKGIIPDTKDPKAGEIGFGVVAGPAATVAGRPGMIWNLAMVKGPENDRKKQVEFVMSLDAALAPVGGVFQRTIVSLNDLLLRLFPAETQFVPRLSEVMAKGAPLRITPVEAGATKPEGPLIEFKSLDQSAIDAKHFELPGPVTSIDELMGMLGSMDLKGGAGTAGGVEKLP